MADLQARKAAIQKASAQVRAGGVFVRRSTAAGVLSSNRSGTAVAVGRSNVAAKNSAQESR